MGKKKAVILISLLIIGTVAVILQLNSFRQGSSNIIEENTANLLAPIQSFFSNAGKRISTTWQSFTKISKLEEENRKLRYEIYSLKEEQEKFNRTQDENRTLRSMLDISTRQKGRIIAAEVIARSPDNWFESIRVNKGFKQGVKLDMAAISPEGLVGRVVAVSEYTAKVRLIFNEKSAVPAQIVSTGDLGVVYGEEKNTCVMRYIHADAQVNVGDKVITSRLGRVFPPGKIIGEVSKIYGRDNIMYKAVQVKPTVQFGNLEYVLLVERQ